MNRSGAYFNSVFSCLSWPHFFRLWLSSSIDYEF